MIHESSNEYGSLRRVSPKELGDWLRRAHPTGRSIQWWVSIFESAETEALEPLHHRQPANGKSFEFAASLLDAGIQDSVSPCYAAYWLLRFAALAIRYGEPIPGLPDAMSPNGSARRALKSIPLATEEAVIIGRRRNAELMAGGDEPAGPEIQTLQDIEWLIPSFSWVYDRVTDPDIAVQISEWVEVYSEIGPAPNAGE